MARELLNKDGSPMREYHSEIIEKLLNEPKQTAVEWLQEQLKKGVDFNPLDKNSYLNNVEKLFQQAKAMEKEQIEDAYSEGVDDEYEYHINNEPRKNSEQYYNETYNK